ncbi:hypothetical protein KA013_02980 [Patescibacteria group bacterium]|nr:hypothetical protein [Patescibacteria group bacterium]
MSYPYTQNNIYWNDISLHAIALQGLSALEGDDVRAQADQVLLSLLKLQEPDGLRGRSTQANMQVFMGLSSFMQARGLQSVDDKITCQISLN